MSDVVASLLAHVAPVAFLGTHAGAKLYVCATAQEAPLLEAAYEGLTWVQIRGVGSHGETGSSTNILTYDTWDDDVIQKAKGMTDAGSPTIELARDSDDPGQVILRTAAETPYNYAFKIVYNDAPEIGGTGTTRYNRGLVSGPTQPNGRNEDFNLEVFTLGLNQKQITVEPADAP